MNHLYTNKNFSQINRRIFLIYMYALGFAHRLTFVITNSWKQSFDSPDVRWYPTSSLRISCFNRETFAFIGHSKIFLLIFFSRYNTFYDRYFVLLAMKYFLSRLWRNFYFFYVFIFFSIKICIYLIFIHHLENTHWNRWKMIENEGMEEYFLMGIDS